MIVKEEFLTRLRRYFALNLYEVKIWKGFVVMKLGKPIKYIAVDPNEVIERVKKNMKQDADEKINRLEKLKGT